jgi:hypothetical protein
MLSAVGSLDAGQPSSRRTSLGDSTPACRARRRSAAGRAGAGEGREAVTKRAQARSLLERLRRMPDATPAKLLAEFKRLVADDLKAKGKAR